MIAGYRLLAMIMPVAIAKMNPVKTSMGMATGGPCILNNQPVRAPVTIATGTTSTLQKTPAMGHMLDPNASGVIKHVRKAHEE